MAGHIFQSRSLSPKGKSFNIFIFLLKYKVFATSSYFSSYFFIENSEMQIITWTLLIFKCVIFKNTNSVKLYFYSFV